LRRHLDLSREGKDSSVLSFREIQRLERDHPQLVARRFPASDLDEPLSAAQRREAY